MIRAIIIDDEQHCVDRLTQLLEEELADTVHVMDSFTTVAKGMEAIQKYKPELVFLDVQLDAGKTAFDMLRELGIVSFSVIFTTAYEKYAVQAFKFSALDYLLKPVNAIELKQAVAKLAERNPRIETTQKLETLLGNLYSRDKKICVPVMNGLVVLNVNDIIRCESEINYTTIFLKDKHKLTVSKTLKEFEELLIDYNFFRLHNTHLVNLSFIRSYNKGRGGSVTLLDGMELEVSTRRKDGFLKKLTER